MLRKPDSEEVKELKQTIGKLLRKMRESKAVKRRSVVRAQPWLTGAKLRKYERGSAALPVSYLAKLVEQYNGDVVDFQLALFEAGNHFRTQRELKAPKP
jgi:hypothetical protein